MKTLSPSLLFLFFALNAFNSQASDNPCLLPNVHQYSVLVHPFTTDPARANLRFQALGDARKEEVIVFLPGGPGQEVIAEYDPIHYDQDFASAPGVPMLVLQARGSGCNEEAFRKFPESVFTTEILAADALQLIRELKLKRYWLYGASYGTHVATVLAHLIERDPAIAKPQGIVLTGVGALPLPRGRSAADDFF